MRGNVIDMAICIIIGAAFGKIVSSVVSIPTPPVISNEEKLLTEIRDLLKK